MQNKPDPFHPFEGPRKRGKGGPHVILRMFFVEKERKKRQDSKKPSSREDRRGATRIRSGRRRGKNEKDIQHGFKLEIVRVKKLFMAKKKEARGSK